MKARILMSAVLISAFFCSGLSATETPGQIVVNSDFRSVVTTAHGKQEVHGRMSGHLSIPGQSLESGVYVGALNIALFGVDQEKVTGTKSRGKPTGGVGFAIDSTKGPTHLRWDAASRSLAGRVEGRLDLAQIYELVELPIDPKDDLVEVPTMKATLEVRLDLADIERLEKAHHEVVQIKGGAQFKVIGDKLEGTSVVGLEIDAALPHVDYQLSFLPVEPAQRLCLQPVRIGRLVFRNLGQWFIHYSGDGLDFGMPGAWTQWNKADVVFNVRDWITIWDFGYSTLSAGEEAALLNEINVDDCIEIFFVDRFSPSHRSGGGATWGAGNMTSKIISSDENADFGIDLTHLAHELGHVLGLKHPGAAGNAASSGTLMCGSGFQNDNPRINSVENAMNLRNPLLEFSLKLITPGPDCLDSADCGPCF